MNRVFLLPISDSRDSPFNKESAIDSIPLVSVSFRSLDAIVVPPFILLIVLFYIINTRVETHDEFVIRNATTSSALTRNSVIIEVVIIAKRHYLSARVNIHSSNEGGTQTKRKEEKKTEILMKE